MPKERINNEPDKKIKNEPEASVDRFNRKPISEDEIESDGSASAFEETETVTEDNFDDLSEK